MCCFLSDNEHKTTSTCLINNLQCFLTWLEEAERVYCPIRHLGRFIPGTAGGWGVTLLKARGRNRWIVCCRRQAHPHRWQDLSGVDTDENAGRFVRRSSARLHTHLTARLWGENFGCVWTPSPFCSMQTKPVKSHRRGQTKLSLYISKRQINNMHRIQY